jgi:signal transduction histidine kinase
VTPGRVEFGARLGARASAVGALALGLLAVIDAPHAGEAARGAASAVLVAGWALAALATAGRTARLGGLVGLIALFGGGALCAARLGHRAGPALLGTPRALAVTLVLAAAAVSLHVLLALPSGRLTTSGRRLGAAAGYAVAAVLAAALALRGRGLAPWASVLAGAVVLGLVAPAFNARYVAARTTGRQRMQCAVAGAALALTAAVATWCLHLLVNWPGDVAPTLVAAAVLVPLGLAASTLRAADHADRVLVASLELLGAVAVVGALFLVVLRGFTRIPTGHEERVLVGWTMAAAALAVVVLLGVRGRIARGATRATYGTREAPDEVIRTFGSRLTRAIPMDELLLQLVESLRKTLTLARAEIYTGSSESLERTVSVPDRGPAALRVTSDERAVIARAGVSGNAWAAVWLPTIAVDYADDHVRIAPISHAGELLGMIVISRPVGAVPFREEDDRVLADLARQVGLALHNAQLDTALQSTLDELRQQADELRASRARVVASGDAERRRVERNLHDGAQQHLVALAVNLRLAKDSVLDDPDGAVEMLGDLVGAVQETIQELRELAHGIYPPLLVDAGLGEALRAVAGRSPLDIDLQTEGLARYGGDLEAALYFCCLEALQNAGKHAPNAHVVVRVWEESGALLFEVVDDGPGFDARTATRGHGYTNMADRLGAIGGAVRWDSSPGEGTRIRGSVPLA